jgi:hypothetical protein
MIRLPHHSNIIIFFICIALAGCSKHEKPLKLSSFKLAHTPSIQSIHQKTKHQLLVFVHGTILPVPSFECFGASLHDFLAKGRTLKKSWYQLYLDNLKQNSLFKYQPSGPEGLCLINEINCTFTAQITQAIFSDLYEKLYPNTKLHCYVFGWNGRLSHKKRIRAAQILYQQIMQEYQKYNPETCSIELIGHSHGGNVILALALAEELYKQNIIIEKTILLGTPMQSETQPFLTSPIFKKVYSLYSHGDCIQKIDILSTNDDYSQRRFSMVQNTKTAAKLTEIELEVGAFKPGHSDLWLYNGKRNPVYNKKLPINPFPVLVFLPEIIKNLEKTHIHYPHLLVHLDATIQKYVMHFYNKKYAKNDQKYMILTATADQKYFTPYLPLLAKN